MTFSFAIPVTCAKLIPALLIMFEACKILLVLACLSSVSATYDFLENSDWFPETVEKFEVRLDDYTKQPVRTGLVHTLPPKSTLAEFKKHLQCTEIEPNLAYNSGITNILEMVPPTSETLKLMCTYLERHLGCNWNQCREEQKKLIEGEMNKGSKFANARLVRVIKGETYFDWPWGMERYDEMKEEDNLIIPLISMTVSRISDLGDSAFFVGSESPYIPYDKPIPFFSFSTGETNADMPWPWWEMWQSASRSYKLFRKNKVEFTEANFKKETLHYLEWHKRIPKAAFFSSLTKPRQFLYDAARMYPDLFDARFAHSECISAWNPSSSEKCDVLKSPTKEQVQAAQSLPAGYLLPLMNMSTTAEELHEAEKHLASFKYIVVPLGNQMTSDRLAQILAYSGAVVLMQRSTYKYHMSAYFLPWVHYVPTSYSGADVFEKVQWLKLHDGMAQQIAENGRNFARSYLRLEDYYCYAANALERMAEYGAMTDVTAKPFTPRKILPFKIKNHNETDAYDWPV